MTGAFGGISLYDGAIKQWSGNHEEESNNCSRNYLDCHDTGFWYETLAEYLAHWEEFVMKNIAYIFITLIITGGILIGCDTDAIKGSGDLITIEKDYEVRFKSLEILKCKNVGDLQKLIDSKTV